MVNDLFRSFRPLPCRTIERTLRNLGFIEDAQKSTSHRQWRKLMGGRLYKVTLDCHKGEVSAVNVRSIIKQTGVTKKEFFEAIIAYQNRERRFGKTSEQLSTNC